MKQHLGLLAVALMAFFIAACSGGEPAMDTSTDEAMEASYTEIAESLSDEKRRKFEEALSSVYMEGALNHMDSDMSEDEIMDRVNEDVHGKTADEIISMAENSEERIQEKMQEMQQ
ncbi:hypothetical protein DES49_1427 [Halospina denitrificans]|uniref:Uncharacterized protein n=1 Tax=Halospina denitrificans TaxID=332522 RepID=A0A4R7JTX2_9GAMM|nr:DUF6694 family lipoprotein [Halospina denitrificans]TDT41344.1 hypothetical protein DES49_1427 [Halospina denitrificans]